MSEKALASEDDFVTWLVSSSKGLKGLLIAVLYVVVVASKNISHVATFIPDYSAHKMLYDAIPSLFQCVALVPALWQCAIVEPPESLRASYPIAAQACDQFSKCLSALIATWIVFYALVFFWQIKPIHGTEPWTDLSNNMQAVFLFACYWTLTAITIPEPGSSGPNDGKVGDSMSLPLILSFSFWIVLVFLFADLSLSVQASATSRFWIQLASGMSVGVCVALLTGCLESEYLSAPWTRCLTACLYCYAVLQLAYIGFNSDPSGGSIRPPLERFLAAFATITSLPLKLLLIGVCFWALREGRLAFYMEKTRTLIRNVPAEWDQFHNSFSDNLDKNPKDDSATQAGTGL